MKVDSETSSSTRETAESQFSSYATPLVDDAISRAAVLNADPDAEVLHKLRVALRRLRSLLWAYRPLLNSIPNPCRAGRLRRNGDEVYR
ncbi:CHAD domain-containing protein [Caballeronia mineralivorans]|jgi:CHAD domain-containing protein|uniref:CHAD domain-containing protein n=1 Tax=Caballeronia mineralivorans TaxID=2010198 RepID=UPI003211E81F|nr:Adenylate cyclase [Caballeronia mineralivorans]